MKIVESAQQISILDKTLLDLKKTRKLCEIKLDHPKETLFCHIIDSNELMTLAHKISPDTSGFDGFSLIFNDNIANVSWEGELLEQLEILLDEKSKVANNPLDKIANVNINNHFFKIIRTVNSLFGHVSIYDINEDGEFFFGQVKDIDDEFMLIRLMGDRQFIDDRNIIIRLADIGRIDFGGVYDENMLRLHKIKRRNK